MMKSNKNSDLLKVEKKCGPYITIARHIDELSLVINCTFSSSLSCFNDPKRVQSFERGRSSTWRLREVPLIIYVETLKSDCSTGDLVPDLKDIVEYFHRFDGTESPRVRVKPKLQSLLFSKWENISIEKTTKLLTSSGSFWIYFWNAFPPAWGREGRLSSISC